MIATGARKTLYDFYFVDFAFFLILILHSLCIDIIKAGLAHRLLHFFLLFCFLSAGLGVFCVAYSYPPL